MDTRKKVVTIAGIIFIIIGLVQGKSDIEYLFKEKTVGTVMSDGYLFRKSDIFSKYPKYVYVVEYEVDGVKYKCNDYNCGLSYMKQGDQIELYYLKREPEELLTRHVPITGFCFLYLAGVAFFMRKDLELRSKEC